MTLLERVTDAVERMDTPDVDPDALTEALDHIVAVNRWLGTRRALRRHLPWALRSDRMPLRVLDVGTGSGDLARLIARWAREHERPVEVTALDRHGPPLELARTRSRGAAVHLVQGDGLRLPFGTGAFEVAHLSMTLHHMNDRAALVGILRELGRVARGGRVLVGELERAVPNYLGARLLAATVWRRNPVTRHDGPLSVLRAFTPDELLGLGRAAGFRRPTVHRHPFYRLVLRAEA